MALAAGRLRSRIAIERKQKLPDGQGGNRHKWIEIGKAWAEVLNQSGREALIAGAVQGLTTWKVTMRWRPDISAVDRLIHQGAALNIKSIGDPDGRREALVMICESGGASDA